MDEEMSYSLATHTAAVFLTYGSSSLRHLRSGSQRYSVILSTRMQPIVRTASARIRGFESSQSWNDLFRKEIVWRLGLRCRLRR